MSFVFFFLHLTISAKCRESRPFWDCLQQQSEPSQLSVVKVRQAILRSLIRPIHLILLPFPSRGVLGKEKTLLKRLLYNKQFTAITAGRKGGAHLRTNRNEMSLPMRKKERKKKQIGNLTCKRLE